MGRGLVVFVTSPLELQSKRGDWMTPADVRSVLAEFSPVGFDPCPAPSPDLWFAAANESGDGLASDWSAKGLVFCNPPYRPLAPWAEKAAAEAKRGAEIIFLCPPRTGTVAFQQYIRSALRLCFWAKRIAFIDSLTARPVKDNTTDSIFAYWGPRSDRFARVFGKHGRIYTPVAT